MSTGLFKDWFFSSFVPEVRQYLRDQNLTEKAVLVLDNALVHPKADDLVSGDIWVIYLPPNVTATVQPMDQHVLQALKEKYRRDFLLFLLHEMEES